MLDLADLQEAVPKNMKVTVTPELVAKVNNLINDPEERKAFAENAITFTKVLTEGKYRITDYLNAVRYVTHKVNGCTNIDAYIRTFPERYKEFLNKGHSEKQIASSVSIYNRTQLVTRIMEQSIVPIRIFNQDKRQLALDTLVSVIKDPKASDKSKIDASNTILTHLADPQDKGALNINIQNNHSAASDIIAELGEAMNKIAEQSRARVINGEVTSTQAANLVAVEVKDE